MRAEWDAEHSEGVPPHGFIIEPYLDRRIDRPDRRMSLRGEARHRTGALTVIEEVLAPGHTGPAPHVHDRGLAARHTGNATVVTVSSIGGAALERDAAQSASLPSERAGTTAKGLAA